ncbi:hypothetical protein ACWEL8_25980 [Streptomyces sp. NPDC004690]
MAHSAPVSGRTANDRRSWPPRRSLDFFGQRAHLVGRWAVPLGIGLVYGYWVAANRRDGGPITGGNVAYGFVTTIVFTLVVGAMLTVAPRLAREPHAALWGLVSGAALGFLMGQSPGASPLQVFVVALAFALAVGLIVFYWEYTHEDARGRRVD